MNNALTITGLRKSFGAAEIIRGVDLEIQDGERHAIIGPNGAGKSTLYNLISGRFPPSSGRIHLHDVEITNKSPFQINRMGLTRSFQVTNIFARMSVLDNIRCGCLFALGYRYAWWKLVDRLHDLNARTAGILRDINLWEKRDLPAGLLSYADQRALELGIAVAGGAETILLDEPTAGMSRSEIGTAVSLIRRISEGKTLLIVEHDMGVVFDLADRISVLVYGEIIATGTPGEIRSSAAVQEAYLGTGSGQC